MKMIVVTVVAVIYLIVSIAEFILMGSDKMKAKKHQWRIPEKVLLGLSVFGGSIGALAGMYAFRHKTKHWYFVATFWISFVVQMGLLIALFIFVP